MSGSTPSEGWTESLPKLMPIAIASPPGLCQCTTQRSNAAWPQASRSSTEGLGGRHSHSVTSGEAHCTSSSLGRSVLLEGTKTDWDMSVMRPLGPGDTGC